MTKTVEFIFDFGSPNAYLAHKVLPEIATEANVALIYVPCLLGGIFKSTGNQSPMQAYAGIPAKLRYQQLEMQRFIEKHELTSFRFNPHFPVNTLILMRGAIAADVQGALSKYCDTGFKAMWEDGLKMDDPDVFVDVFTQAGMDGKALLEQTQDPGIKTKLVKNTQSAVDRRVFGSPTFFVGEEMFFGKERLDQMKDEVLK